MTDTPATTNRPTTNRPMTDGTASAISLPDTPGDDGFLTLRVRHVDHDTDSSVVITFDTDHLSTDIDLTFRHGQHLTVRRRFHNLDDDPRGEQHPDSVATVEVRRSYSLCSPAPDGDLRIAVKRVDGGVFSTWATRELTEGDTLDVLPPAGSFTHPLDAGAARRYAMIAAGSGITPIYSIMATVLASEPQSQVDLLYINRSSADTMLLDDVLGLRDRYLDRCRVSFLFTREASDSELLSGRPDRARFAALISAGIVLPQADDTFLCGPEALLDAATDALVEAGTQPESIHRELFTTSQTGQVRSAPVVVADDATPIAQVSARLHGRTSQADLYEGDTVLEAIERVRPDAPYSCRAGVCSTCQAKAPLGTVTMDVNVGLTDAEVDRGLVLTCQSRPMPGVEVVEVDFDV